jgi:hypothetical protein
MDIKAFEKRIKFIFLFFTTFGILLFVLIFFHIHFSEPILSHLTTSHDFKCVFQSSGIQNKQPLSTVYPLDSRKTTVFTALDLLMAKVEYVSSFVLPLITHFKPHHSFFLRSPGKNNAHQMTGDIM